MRFYRPLATSLAAILAAACIATPVAAARVPEAQGTAAHDVIMFIAEDTPMQKFLGDLKRSGVNAADIDVRRTDMVVVSVESEQAAARVASLGNAIDGVTSTGVDNAVEALENVPPSDPAYLDGAYPQRDYLGPASVAAHSIHLEPVWDSIFNGTVFTQVPDRAGVPVAVIDTGASPSLLEDTGRYRGIWDYVNDDPYPYDDSVFAGFHGTRVASMVQSQTDNAWGIAGVTYDLDVKVMIYKCLNDHGAGSSADSMQAMRDAADDGARVINLSFGERATVSSYDNTPNQAARAAWQDTVDYCVARGAVVVAASGNAADDSVPYTPVYYPAACDGAIAVGSIDVTSGDRSEFSCYGPELDIVAPGQAQPLPRVGVWSALPSGASDSAATGTSFAAPLVTGSTALLWSLVPDLPAQTMKDIVLASADGSYGDAPSFDLTTGWGLLDVWAGYDEMTRTVPAQPPVSVSAAAPHGIETVVSWTAAPGADVSYLYGYVGGPAYATTGTSGRLVLPGDGTHTVWVRSFATDRWGAQSDATATATVSGGFAPIVSERLAGSDRYDTAAAVSRSSFATRSAQTAVVASGADWPDALSASSLAFQANGPVLLSKKNTLPVVTRDELRRLSPDTVFIVGGAAAISDDVESAIRTVLPLGTSVVRLGGSDRYDTSRIVAQYTSALPGSDSSALILASGTNYPDALSAGPVAAAAGWPVLLTRSATLPSATRNAINQLDPDHVYVVGGTSAISEDVFQSLPGPVRWAGSTRYATSRVIAEQAELLGVLESRDVEFATGRSFPDALTAGPYAAWKGEPVVLVDSLTQDLESWLGQTRAEADILTLFGGSAAVSYDTEFDLLTAVRTAATNP